MGKGAGTHMQGYTLPQSCAAVGGALPQTPAIQCWALAQTCPVAPQELKAPVVSDPGMKALYA